MDPPLGQMGHASQNVLITNASIFLTIGSNFCKYIAILLKLLRNISSGLQSADV